MGWLSNEYFGHSLRAYLIAGGSLFAVPLGFRLLRWLAVERLRVVARRTTTRVDDLIVELLQMVRRPEQYLIGLYAASRPLHLPAWAERSLRALVLVAVTYRLVRMLQRALAFAIREATAEEAPAPGAEQTARTLTLLANAAVVVLAVLFVLSNLGVNITSMVAGLGIGGVAVALAAQAVLGDLFSAFAIWLDRPFELGDFVVFDGFMGTVDDIGIKTTRVRALSGELLVIPNAALTSTKIRNFKQMTERRVALTIGVAYKTPVETLARLPSIVERIARAEELVRFDRVHVDKLSESSIDLELVYWVRSPDFNHHMDVKQRILLGVLRAFEAEGVEIPFPHRTVVLAGAPSAAAAAAAAHDGPRGPGKPGGRAPS